MFKLKVQKHLKFSIKNKQANKKKQKKKILQPTLPELFSYVTVNTGIFFFGLITNKKYVKSLINF